MKKTKIIADAFIYAMQKTFDNFGLYCLSMLASIGAVVASTILFLGTYVLIIANCIPQFQELLRLFFAGKAITNVGGKIASSETAMTMTKEILASFTPTLIIVGALLFILFSIAVVAILAGHINMLLNVYNSGRGSIGDFFMGFSFAPGIYLINIVAMLIAVAPFLLCIPLIFWAKTMMSVRIFVAAVAGITSLLIGSRFYLSQYFYIDTEKSILQSLTASWQATKDSWHLTTLLIVISVLLSTNSTVMLIAQFPFVLMVIYVYRSLKEKNV